VYIEAFAELHKDAGTQIYEQLGNKQRWVEGNKDRDKGKKMEEVRKEGMPGKKGQIMNTFRRTTLGRTPLYE
jgi:hypothetical protein